MSRFCEEKEEHEKCDIEVLCVEGVKCVVGDVLRDLRLDLIGELGAINQYAEHAKRWKDKCPEAAELFCDTMNDEKKHVAEFTALIAKLDPTQAFFFKEVGCPFK